jgi:hypothetical protein
MRESRSMGVLSGPLWFAASDELRDQGLQLQ